jgi:hypothetical protein
LEATVGQKSGQIDEGVASLEQIKKQMWLGWDTHNKCKSKQGENNRNKNVCWGWKLRKRTKKKYEQRVTCSKSSVVVALCLLPTERMNLRKKTDDF